MEKQSIPETSSFNGHVVYLNKNHTIYETEINRVRGNDPICPTIVYAMQALIKQTVGVCMEGLVSWFDMFNLSYDGEDRILICMQLHFNDVSHFFNFSWDPMTKTVLMYDSLVLLLTDLAKLHLWLLYDRINLTWSTEICLRSVK